MLPGHEAKHAGLLPVAGERPVGFLDVVFGVVALAEEEALEGGSRAKFSLGASRLLWFRSR